MKIRSMLLRYAMMAAIAVPVTLVASHKVVSPTASAGNDNVEITATVTLAEAEIAQKLGADPGAGVALLEVKVSPKTDKGLRISPDDFYLLSHDDGQRSQAFEPEQLAGKGALVVSQGQGSPNGLGTTRPGIPIGNSPTGQIRRLPGNSSGIGNSASTPGELKAEADKKGTANDALLKALKAKRLPDTTSTDEVSGMLCFPLEGKHKLKNLAVLYRGQGGRLDLDFEH